ncbi:MAG: cyclic nucleotide-binding domain-containing protein [Spirochaetota bacterium]
MDNLDRSRVLRRERLAAGSVLIAAGTRASALTIIHSGLAELLEPGPPARRVGLIRGESLCGVTALRDTGGARRTVRAITDCVVSNVPVDPATLAERLATDAELNRQVFGGLVQRIESAIYLFRNYKYLWHKLASIADSIALAYDFGPGLLNVESADRLESDLPHYSAYLRARAVGAGLDAPALWDPNVLIGRIQDALALYADRDRTTVESSIDLPQVLFLKRLLGRASSAVAELLEHDEPSTVYIYQFLARSLDRLVAENTLLVGEIERLLDRLFDTDGWIAAVLDAEGGDTARAIFAYYLAKACHRFHKDTTNLLGRRLDHDYPLYRRLGELRRHGDPRARAAARPDDETLATAGPATVGAEAGPAAAAPGPEAVPGGAALAVPAGADRLAKYRNLTDRLLEFSDLSQKERFAFTELLERFKALPNRLDDEAEARSVRDELAALYWKLYESCFLKIISTDLKSFVPGIMLHFGLVDETLVSEAELLDLDDAYAKALYTDDTIPVMTLPYFLEKIYRGEVNPSVTDLGETFAQRLKAQQKMTKRERESATIFEDTPEDRVRYELRTIAPGTAAILFGSKRRAFPILCSDAVSGQIGRLFVEPDDVARRIEEVRARDFTLFFRDVGLRHRFGTDIVRKEVIPNVVLYPVVGARMMMWQELDGSSRHSPGRLFLPSLFTERYDDALLAALAQFRWELQKTIAGANWMDPVDGGLVGAYYDYIQFYQKNHRLTAEAKERIKTLVAKTRSDRERFAVDYADWVRYEYEGKIRLNPVARDIFYRHCPFPREVREEMAKKPLYVELERKYQNRLRKAILKLESRTRRFERSDEPMPEDLERHLQTLRS